jgi:hypothetical protein
MKKDEALKEGIGRLYNQKTVAISLQQIQFSPKLWSIILAITYCARNYTSIL